MIDSMKQDKSTNPEIRRKVFWLLKRLTSYSLWQRKRDAWKIFAHAYESSIKTWAASEAEKLPADNLPRIYDILSCYNAGLIELRKGNRFVWRNGQTLERAIHEYWTISSYLYPDGDYWERGIQEAPYPPHVEALNKLMRASEFHGEEAPLEGSGPADEPALIESPAWLLDPSAYQHRFYALQYPVFPANLPDVPVATDVLIRSGQEIPVDGIWEPVAVQRAKMLGFLPVGEQEVNGHGCFNYFVRGVRAPKVTGRSRGAEGRISVVDTDWRLVWKDDRYTDGIIPDESEYFLPGPSQEVCADADPGEVMTGSVCPVAGWWQAIGYEHPAIHIAAGAIMPDLSVRDVKGDMVLHYVRWQLVKRG